MALHDEISNQVLEKCINAIPSKYFTTLRVIDELIKSFPEVVERVRSYSERNWRSVIGKAIKRFSVETNLIKQISPASESPARWEKMR
jgi:hypothetical protein